MPAQELSDTQMDLVDNICTFFKQCPKEFDAPEEFRRPGFWTEKNIPLLEKHATAINKWTALSAGKQKLLVCESVAMDVDTLINEDEQSTPSKQAVAEQALAQISYYMQPEVFKALTDPAHANDPALPWS